MLAIEQREPLLAVGLSLVFGGTGGRGGR